MGGGRSGGGGGEGGGGCGCTVYETNILRTVLIALQQSTST